MTKVLTKEKQELITKLIEAVGRSTQRLSILKNITKKESIYEIASRLKIPSSTMSETTSRFETYGLIVFVKKKGKSEVYDKVPLLKQIGSLDQWLGGKKIEAESLVLTKTPLRKKIKVPSSIPFVDATIETDASKMTRPYVVLYLLENSIRGFIDAVMTKKHGTKDWWAVASIKPELINTIKTRKSKEGIHKWHVPRGSHEIYYTNLDDLPYFLHKEPDFKNHLDVEHWSNTIKVAVTLSRNIVDHHNPLPEREVKRLETILEDWKRQLSGISI